MFFRNKRKKVAEFILGQLSPMLVTLQYRVYGSPHQFLPAYFWQSPYALGFIGALIGQFSNFYCKGQASAETKGFALIDVFSCLSQMDGRSITNDFTEYAESKDPAFTKGVDNALLYTSYCFRLLKNETQHEAIQYAKELAPKVRLDFGDASDARASVAGVLLHNVFVSEVLQRLPQLKEEKAPLEDTLQEIDS